MIRPIVLATFLCGALAACSSGPGTDGKMPDEPMIPVPPPTPTEPSDKPSPPMVPVDPTDPINPPPPAPTDPIPVVGFSDLAGTLGDIVTARDDLIEIPLSQLPGGTATFDGVALVSRVDSTTSEYVNSYLGSAAIVADLSGGGSISAELGDFHQFPTGAVDYNEIIAVDPADTSAVDGNMTCADNVCAGQIAGDDVVGNIDQLTFSGRTDGSSNNGAAVEMIEGFGYTESGWGNGIAGTELVILGHLGQE